MSKYLSEFTLNLYVQYKYLVPSTQVYKLESDLRQRDYHLYFIVATPIWYIKDGSVEVYKDRFSCVVFSYQFDGYIEKKVGISFPIKNNESLLNFEVKIPHPGNKLLFTCENEDKSFGFEADFLAKEHCWKMVTNKLKHKVLYIGQAYGKNGERLSIDRILSHQTYQKILMEAPEKYPNCNIEVLFLDFAVGQTLSIDGRNKSLNNQRESLDHLQKVLSNPVKVNEAYNICEATLIYFFQPEYNKDFKKYYPSRVHKSYQEYYNLDYKNLWIEMDLDFGDRPDCILFTDAYTANSYFIDMVYDLRNNTLYKSARSFLDKDSVI